MNLPTAGSRPGRVALEGLIAMVGLLLVGAPLAWGTVLAQEIGHHDHAYSHQAGLDFAHPLIAESPWPHSKLRLDYFFRTIDLEGERDTEGVVQLEVEYTLLKSLSVGAKLPFMVAGTEGRPSGFDTQEAEFSLTFATSALQRRDFLLGFGVEFDLHIGDDGHGHGRRRSAKVEPFLDMGYRWRDLEVVAVTMLGIPTGKSEEGGIDTDFGYSLSFLYRFATPAQGLLEFEGWADDHELVTRVTPGVKFRPMADEAVWVGLGASFPLLAYAEFDRQAIISLFYHF